MTLVGVEVNGVFSRADAAGVGVDHKALSAKIRAGQVRRLCEAHYTARPLGTPEDEHRLRAVAHLRRNPGTALAGVSAVLVARLPTFRTDLARIELARARPGGRARQHVGPGVVIHPFQAPTGRVRCGLIDVPVPSVPLAHALVRMGCRSGVESFLVSADAAVRRGLVTPTDLELVVSSLGARPGTGQVRRALPTVDGRHESPGETRLARVLRLGAIAVMPQFLIRDGAFQARVDFLIQGTSVVVEFDGLVKYTDSEVLRAEKLREHRLAQLGYVVVRVIWSELDHPQAVLARIRQAMARSAAPRAHWPV